MKTKNNPDMKTKKDFKKKEWVTRNRMKFDSGYRKFDRQVDSISPGNVVSNVQRSSIIRPYSDTNGGACEPGACRKFDIDGISHARRIPYAIQEWLDAHPEEKVWLYNFHFRNTDAEPGASIGWILTDYEHGAVIMTEYFKGWIEGHGSLGHKRKAVLDEAVKYVVKGNWD